LKTIKKIPLNIPNILSLYRLFSFPFILYLAIIGQEKIFVILFVINLVTDVLDGWIARKFNMQTAIGAKIDSIADIGSFILAFVGIFVFKYHDFKPHFISFGFFIGLFIFSNLLSLIKFKQSPSLHLYSWKIGGYIQGFFFFVLFVFGFNIYFYYLMVSWGILAFSEHIIIQLIIKKMQVNAKGLYWVLKNRKSL
jgi:CDP-diacylglycerol--glycerol-3-phosphate 3-phosphatidyltransferase